MAAARIAARAETARTLLEMVGQVNGHLSGLDEEDRRRQLIRLEHERPVELSGTGLKCFGPPGEHITLAVLKPGEESLAKLEGRINEFGSGQLQKGQPKHKEIDSIHAIRRAEPTDRLSDGLFSNYSTLIAAKEPFAIEIEIVSLLQGSKQQRAEIQAALRDLEAFFRRSGEGQLHEHEEAAGTCRAVISCTGAVLRTLVESPEWIGRIAWLEDRPRFEPFSDVKDDFRVDRLGDFIAPADDAPAVCIIDSGVTPKNPFLAPVVRPGLLKSFLGSDPDNPFDSFGHGSGVASLAAYFAINLADGAENKGRVWIASARIVTAKQELEDERLFSSLLKQVVEHFKPLGVRIFNLSIGNNQLKWNQQSRRTADRKSWVARTIDRLSREHDVVFVTCTGNLPCPDINAYTSGGQQYPTYFADSGAAILDPGQAALALTVGSIAPGTLVANNSSDTAVAAFHQASPFTRSGPGITGECKPELVDFGGNLARAPDGRVRPASGLHVAMATHQQTPAVTYSCGTSFAAPRVAHKLALVLADLQALGHLAPTAALLKAFLINSARHMAEPETHDTFVTALEALDKGHWRNVLGYGQADADRATACDDHSYLLFYEGCLERNKVAFFDIPVPASLAGTGKKRLTVTVVSTPQVQRNGLESYLGTTTKWRMYRGDVPRVEVIAAMSKEEEKAEDGGGEATQDEGGPIEELKFALGVTRRSLGTVQHDWYEWTQHKASFSVGQYTLAIASYEKWGRQGNNVPPLPFAVVVRLEDIARKIPLYNEVRQLLQVPLQT